MSVPTVHASPVDRRTTDDAVEDDTVGYAPAVTVVVPTHDRPQLMAEAVRSVLNQEYAGPLEVVVVFDACDPVLPDVVTGPTQTLRAVVNERTRGLAGARNSGILAASHDFVAFLDDDDTWLAGKLAAQMPLFRDHPDVRLVATAMQVDDGERLTDRLVPSDVVSHAELVRERFGGLHSSSFVFRREALVHEIGMIDEDLPRGYAEDTDVLLGASRLAPVRLVNEPLVRVRWQGQSYFFGRWADYAAALTYLLAKHPEFADDDAAHSRMLSQIAFGEVSSGQRAAGRRHARRAIALRRTNLRAWLALVIGLRLATTGAVVTVARRFGKGI